MKRETWILAISGMMALAQSGVAADPQSDRNAVGSVKLSSGGTAKKMATSAPAKKNYYKDLFEDADTAATPATKRNVPASAPARATISDWDEGKGEERASSSAKRPVKDAEPTAFDEISIGEEPVSPAASTPSKAATAPEKKNAARVTHALFDRPVGKKGSVQQIRSDGRPRSAPPVSGFEEIEEKVAQPSSGKTASARNEFEDDFPAEPVKTAAAPTAPVAMATAPVQGPQTSQVTVEWAKRGEFNVGQECLVDLIVKNLGDTPVSQVAVDAYFPTNVRLTAAEPKPAAATDHLTWNFEHLAPSSEHKLTVKLIPSNRENIGATAHVRFTGTSATAFVVSEPLLKVSIKSPAKEFMLGDPVSQNIVVTNPGTGTAQEVKIEATLSEGLEHPTRETRLTIDVGMVGPGETRTYRLPLTACKGGAQSVSVVATSNTDATSADAVKFDVVAPSLKVTVDGPSLRYRGRNAKYTLKIVNDGSLANNNIHVSQAIADGFKYVSSDHNGKYDPSVKTVNWFVGRLEPGEEAQLSCELNSLQIGEFIHNIQVVSDTGVQADAQIETRVDGIASLTMELVDLDDPVETGAETGYEIRVKNDGSKTATGVVVACELPAGMEFLDCKAPVGQVLEGRQLTFKAIEEIPAGGHAEIRIRTKVSKEGSHRIRVKLTGGGLQEPMVLEEVTRAYSDSAN